MTATIAGQSSYHALQADSKIFIEQTGATQVQYQCPVPAVQPPAKKTKPDGSDAPANLNRACPSPWETRIQLLLVEL
jgi:hypothetical protein